MSVLTIYDFLIDSIVRDQLTQDGKCRVLKVLVIIHSESLLNLIVDHHGFCDLLWLLNCIILLFISTFPRSNLTLLALTNVSSARINNLCSSFSDILSIIFASVKYAQVGFLRRE